MVHPHMPDLLQRYVAADAARGLDASSGAFRRMPSSAMRAGPMPA